MADGPEARAGALLRQLVHRHFQSFVQEGCNPNEAAVKALAAARLELQAGAAVVEGKALQPSPEPPGVVVDSRPSTSSPAAAGKYGPLCLGLAGPFQSICIVGEPRRGKKLLVLDIDHTIYDPSDHEGSRGSVVRSNHNGFYDESVTARCRPGLHEFLTGVYKEYDIMVWSASDMIRILTLLQQLGICGAGHSDYRLVAVLDVDSMSELSSGSMHDGADDGASTQQGALVQPVVVPPGALPGQQIEVRCITDGSPMVVSVPQGLRPGDVFHVAPPGAVSGASEELGVDASDMELALQLSLGQRPSSGAAGEALAPLPKARRRGRSVKPLSLIWACSEFSHVYSERNSVIVDDTIDVCSANPHNSIQCIRYFWRDHTTDTELIRLKTYLLNISQAPEFPKSHERWREGL